MIRGKSELVWYSKENKKRLVRLIVARWGIECTYERLNSMFKDPELINILKEYECEIRACFNKPRKSTFPSSTENYRRRNTL